ncbi:MAG: 30S ribosomal protein S17 [Candidatus Doudnabacteria bacterium RIFCSPHIGHO2_02_FULL_46_11]|uniref:Small ribosomal subunit protein uS17 n=1 Tax=Candidatus Doudnabacteria bacterium RIFCSPHIGHO2_02_FULL_46_11 TaxID=1817832 RepID=A0A1F5P5G2_9BACT|nr:ribosomal protein S17 [uncultured bacterium]OGE85106.1 MAG: 30S ribosomal protein S17 [Candidatus Doudnabacteria bacterium RIFCSPHIGHO2_02_FULL_46_11]
MADNSLNKQKHGVITGTVVSDKMNQTRVVEVKSRKTHPKYKKIYTVSKRFKVHDPKNSSHLGDTVAFIPSKPFSKTKKFIIVTK